MTKHLQLQKILATLLTMAALFARQQAFATSTDFMSINGQSARIDMPGAPGYFTGRFNKEIVGYQGNASGWHLIASPLADSTDFHLRRRK